MVLWDIRYGVVLASSSPPSSSSSSSSTASHLVSLSPCNALAQSFLLSARDSVTVWTLRLPSTQSGSLLSVLGRMEDTREELAATSRNTVVQPPVVATVTAPTDLVEQAAWQTAVAEAVALEQSLSSSLNESRSPAAFQAAFERLWNASAPVAHRAALASPAFVARVLDRCLSDAAFRPSGVLVAVVEAGRVPARAIPALVDVCIDDANLRLLEALLVHAHAMPEEQLVRCLRFVLAGAGGSARAYVGERTAVARKGVPAVHALDDRDSPRDALLHLCVSAPRNDAFLVDQLRLLDVAETTDLLAYLLRWLDRYENISAEQLRNSCNSRIPSQTQVLDWIGLVLDASLTRLLLLPSCHEQLAQLAGSLSLATDACSSMSVLRGHLEQLLERKTMPTATDAAALYTIEVLRL